MSATSASGPRRRGDPLIALGLVAVIWLGFRATSIAGVMPIFTPGPADEAAQDSAQTSALATALPENPRETPRTAPALAVAEVDEVAEAEQAGGAPVMRLALPTGRSGGRVARAGLPDAPARQSGETPALAVNTTPQDAVRVPLPPSQPATLAQAQVPGASAAAAPVAPAPVRDQPDRWSGDAWVFWRRDSDAPLAPGGQGYGRSQAGAVIRLAMIPASAIRPQAHLRASAAIEGPREREVAAGVSARLGDVPVRVAAEARLTETALGTELRPAAFAVTEIPSFDLPAGLTGETYIQGGYVGGDFNTAFIDGQLGVAREFRLTERSRFRLGGGVWGGAQRGATRLDVGPSAQVLFPIGSVNARLSADYRFRIAGDAQPSSGPTLTLSAGF